MSTLPIRDRSQCPEGSTWDPGIELVYPLAERRQDRALVETTIPLLVAFAATNSVGEATDDEINGIARALPPARKALRDLFAHQRLIQPCDPYNEGMRAFVQRNNDLLRRWSAAQSNTLARLRQLAPERLAVLPLVQALLAEPPTIQEDVADRELTDAIGRARHQAHMIEGQALAARASAPHRGNDDPMLESLLLGYRDFQQVFLNPLIESARLRISEAKEQSLTVSQLLARNIGVPETLFPHWCSVLRKHLPLFQRYLRHYLRVQRVNEVPILDLFLYPGGGKSPMSFDQAFDFMVASCAPLGREYADAMTALRTARRIDHCPNQGRHSESRMVFLRRQPFLRVNYNGSFKARRAVAHEVTHAVHMTLDQRSSSPMLKEARFMVETVAAVGEAFHFWHQLKTTPSGWEHFRLLGEELWQNMLDTFTGNLWAELELSAYTFMEAGGTLDSPWMCERFLSLVREYTVGVPIAKLSQMGVLWAQNNAYFNAPTLQFMYPPTRALAWHISNNMRKNGSAAVNDYLTFLRMGNHVASGDALLTIGVDLNSDDCYDYAFRRLASIVDILEPI